ncbi:MAG: hypothetical protein U5K54_05020 [Cytophagales bacterium]|nr:hypothetical protein [Cytophagales bacterium]
MKKSKFIICFLLLLSAHSMAQKLSAYILEDNDIFNGSDRYYTNGSGVGVYFTTKRTSIFKGILPFYKRTHPGILPTRYSGHAKNVYTIESSTP